MSKISETQKSIIKKILPLMGKISALWCLCAFTLVGLGILSSHVYAQNEYRSLILSDKHNEHYLSPYLTRYLESDKISSVQDIISKPFLQSEVLPSAGSLVLLDAKDDVTWLSFGLSNRSAQSNWIIDFGKGLDGRFGFIQSAEAYLYNADAQKLYRYDIGENPSSTINLPQNQKLQIILKIKNSKALPLTTPLKLINPDFVVTDPSILYEAINLFLIGMIFFFIAVFILKLNISYLFFSIYYVLLAGLLYIQNHWLLLHHIPSPFDTNIYAIFIISMIALVTANTQWHNNDKPFFLRLSFLIPALVSLSALITAHIVTGLPEFTMFFMAFVPSIFTLVFIPLYSLMDGQSKNINTTSFTLGWLIFLFGVCVSILALSGIVQPVPSAVNAYWFTLIPQAFFFAIHARQALNDNNKNVIFSKTLEINENENVTRLKKSKENTEQGRLLKVIEQERKTLNELRKSEARQTEEMRKAKELADQASEGKSNFLAVVSHEIRTPMTGVMGMVRMLLNSNLTKEQTEYAQTIQDSSDAMLALLNDILDFEKIEQGKMTFEEIDFDLHRLIKGVATLMQGHASQKDINLETIVGTDLPQFVRADPTRLRQVLLNLTGNAIKFTEKGSVKITAEFMANNKEDNSYEIYFSVSDEGIGISDSAQKELFRPFSQADKSISRKFGGTGLGLAISKGLINAMDSDININSKEGEGSIFFFTLSMKLSETPGQKAPITSTKLTPVRINKILVVDDNKINQKVVSSFLKDHSYELQCVDSAEEALLSLEKESYNFIFMDIELPGMNGDEATKVIREHHNATIKNTPIIALTGHVDSDKVAEYMSAGMNGFVAKPIDPDKLIQAVKDAEKGVYNTQGQSDASSPTTKEAPYSPPPLTATKPKPQTSIMAPTLTATKLIETPTEPLPKIVTTNTPSKDQGFNTIVIEKKKNPFDTYVTADALNEKTVEEILDLEMLSSLQKHLDADNLKEMLNDVFTKTDEIIEQINILMNQGNIKAITTQCHDLKGMVGNFGLKELSGIANDIEKKANTQPSIIVSSAVSQLEGAKKRAKKALFEWLDEQA